MDGGRTDAVVTPEDIEVPDPILDALNKRGLTLECWVSRLKQELNAKEQDGRPIWPIRQKARQDLIRIRGEMPSESMEHRLDTGAKIEVKLLTNVKPE